MEDLINIIRYIYNDAHDGLWSSLFSQSAECPTIRSDRRKPVKLEVCISVACFTALDVAFSMLDGLVKVDWRTLGFGLLLVVHHFDSDCRTCSSHNVVSRHAYRKGPGFPIAIKVQRSISKTFIYNVNADYTQEMFEFTGE